MMLDGKMFSFWLGLYVFHGMLWRQGTGSKAGWWMLSCLLGQNQLMVYLLSKCGGGENTEVLKNQSHTSAITLRMEKDLQEAPERALLWSLCLFFRKKGRSHHLWGVCAFGAGDQGLFVALPLDPLISAPCPSLWKGGIGLSVIKWSYMYPAFHRIPMEGWQDLTWEMCELLQPIKTRWRILGLCLSSVHLISQAPKSSI